MSNSAATNDTQHAPSYYAASAHPSPERPALRGAIEADICIIGAGYTGLSAGLHLAEAGFKVVILEQAKVGWGASGRNGGQIVHSYSRDIDVIESSYGKEKAKPLAEMMFEGAQIIRDRVAKYNIKCDLKDGGVYAALSKKKVKALEEQKELWEKWGHKNLSLIDQPSEIKKVVNTDRYEAILVDKTGGHFHPLNLTLGEAAAFEQNSGVIYEHSAVTKVDRGANPVVHTAQGQVKAKFVILACNAYIGDLEPKLAKMSMPCGTQVITTEPLGSMADELIPSDYCVEDNNFLLDYYRLSGDKRMIFGGGVIYGARDPAHIESIIRPNMYKVFPQLKNVKVDYGWTGNFLLTLSRMPEVGKLSENIYYSQGCSGHGITFTHLIGRLLAEAIQGQAERFSAFECLPHYPFPGGRLLRVPLTAMGAVWYDLRDKLGV
ncbi:MULTISPECIES: NAD(P)/FAD-dependent oxidoreductase [Undibacterium]|uniref:FAD-binding oxidoreductase n=1 Tax=Undibacterium parvum TaxID=401471 RepID=A0A3S9HPA7_9BURK|nr:MULTISPECIES: FAD-binding oxidoreductase [Undibacterium]AZP13940.1 FAD-binding oxidoreductase [Undibacterium parvum]